MAATTQIPSCLIFIMGSKFCTISQVNIIIASAMCNNNRNHYKYRIWGTHSCGYEQSYFLEYRYLWVQFTACLKVVSCVYYSTLNKEGDFLRNIG
jgi:hypothetical protein